MIRHVGTAILAGALLCVPQPVDLAASQSAATTTQAAPPAQTFRSEVTLFEIDVFVTDRNGRFIKDLTRDDFEIVEDGVARRPDTFALIDLPIPEAADAPPRETVDADVATNTHPQGRLYAIVMDSPSTVAPPGTVSDITYTALARRVVTRFIDEFLLPEDLAAVIHAQGTFTDSQSFTASKTLLRAAVDRFGHGLSGDMTRNLDAALRVQRHRDTYRTLEDVAERLGAITGRRKTILWVGAQLQYEMPECRPDMPLTSLPCQLQARWGFVVGAHRDAMAAATRNNVAIYAIDPSGLTPSMGRSETDRHAALRAVAEDSGGSSIVGTNNFAAGFRNIVRDNSTYYVLGYTPAREYRDGKFHEVQVRVTRPGRFTVRARKGYMAPAPETRVAAAADAAPPPGVSDATRQAIRLPIPVGGRGLALSLFSAAFKGPDAREHSVVIGGQVAGDLRVEGSQTLGLAYQVFTLDNRVQAGRHQTVALDLQPASRARVAADGLHFVERLSLPPGRYEIRYVAEQPGGGVGSVVAPLVVPELEDAVSLSGVLLTSAATASQFMVHDEPSVRAQLGAPPTSVRAFTRGDTITAYAEVYSDDRRVTAGDLTVTGIVTAADGTEVRRAPARPGSHEDRRWPFTVDVATADLSAPGAYTLTIEASVAQRRDVARRQIPFMLQ